MKVVIASTLFYTWLGTLFKSSHSEWNQRCVFIINEFITLCGLPLFSNHALASYLLGFTLWDLAYRFWYFKELGMMTSIIHHVGYGSATYVALSTNTFLEAAPYVAIGELSSFFLDVRWFLIELSLKNTRLFNVTSGLFAVSFFVTRICILALWLYKMAIIQGQWTLAMYYCGFTATAMYLLNMYWFSIILEKARLR